MKLISCILLKDQLRRWKVTKWQQNKDWKYRRYWPDLRTWLLFSRYIVLNFQVYLDTAFNYQQFLFWNLFIEYSGYVAESLQRFTKSISYKAYVAWNVSFYWVVLVGDGYWIFEGFMRLNMVENVDGRHHPCELQYCRGTKKLQVCDMAFETFKVFELATEPDIQYPPAKSAWFSVQLKFTTDTLFKARNEVRKDWSTMAVLIKKRNTSEALQYTSWTLIS